MRQTIPFRTVADGFFRAAAHRVHRTLLLAAVLGALPAAVWASDAGAEAAPPPAVEEVASEAPAAPTADRQPRAFAGFATDAVAARGLWAELRELYLQEDSWFVTSATVAYGWRAWEVGTEMSIDSDGEPGNLFLWAKYVGWKLGPANVGAGILAEAPTGYGDFEGAPFATGSLPLGLWDLRSSFGYVITEDFFYNAACLRPIDERFDFRAELSGNLDSAFGWGDAQLLPGLDVHFVRGDWRILLRLSAGAELHPDPGAIVGLSVALTGV